MSAKYKSPRILIVTPEITYLPEGMGNIANSLNAKAGGLADVSAALITTLFELGADVHVAIPDYRSIFKTNLLNSIICKSRTIINKTLPDNRIHLAQDRAFYYMNHVYSSYRWENIKSALAFQREVINNIVPNVRPDLIHCNDWMTGLIPAMARNIGIPCLFTLHNIYTVKESMAYIEDRGIDTAVFWKQLYFEHSPYNYEESREYNKIDFLVSGIFAAHFVNTVSNQFLIEIVNKKHDFIKESLQNELAAKYYANCAIGILNSPDSSFDPATDDALIKKFSLQNHASGKKKNKLFLQKTLGLITDKNAPVFFWPSRLDKNQKGCQLLLEIIYDVVSFYWEQKLQIVFVANGDYQHNFRDIVRQFNLNERVAVADFNENLARVGYAGSDFMIMPSLFEPCGLPQMICQKYGSIPVARDTGGLHDTIKHLDVPNNKGNGFLFETYDSNGLFWAIKQAMNFYKLPEKIKNRHIKRIMQQSSTNFSHSVTAGKYIELYEKMLKRPFVTH